MKKLYIIQLVLFSIVFSSWNNPYINTTETLQLEYGMPKSDVLEILGNPLYVEKGWPTNDSKNTIVWVYKVRTTDVQSKRVPSGSVVVVKSSNSERPSSSEHHDLVLIFKDNKLVNWESKFEEKSSLLEESSSTIEMSSMPDFSSDSVESPLWSIDFKLSRGYENISDWGWDSWSDDGLSLGANISRSIFGGMNIGFDIGLGFGTTTMLFLEKELFGFDFAISLGKYESDFSSSLESGFKIGIFRDFGKYSVGIETMELESDWGGIDGTANLLTFKYKFR